MKRLACLTLLFAFAASAVAQVDIESRRTLTVQTSLAVAESEQLLGGIGYYWFNQNHYPWTNTALRAVWAGVYVDAELSYFLPNRTNIAVGVAGGGGALADLVIPYDQGERLAHQEFYANGANARFFINEEIGHIPVGDMGALPVNLRGTYAISGAFSEPTSTTKNYTLPPNYLTQTLLAELRIGGIEPGLTARRGMELYVSAEASYRTGFGPFGPKGAEFPVNSEYQRLFGSLSAKIPIGRTTIYGRIAGGLGEDLDEISSWKVGGNLVGVDAWTFTVHGYYTREFFAEDFGLGNLWVTYLLDEKHNVTAQFYGDWAAVKPTPPEPDDWDNYFGVGAGVGFRAFWKTNVLISYGYGINAVRNGDRGGQEIGLALEKKF